MENEQDFVKEITRKSDDFSRWYVEIIRKAKLADYSPMKGMMVIRPYGYAVWELLRDQLDARFKASGHVNAYFPLFIPESFLKKEAEHVAGFAPEVAWVTVGGGEQLEERWAVRPTSEAIICSMYAKWVNSWRDLPLLINQWANVVRWEKVTRPFLRTTEFLWQEGHTVHATAEEARSEALLILDIYRTFAEEVLAVPVLSGRKSASERFAGAVETFAIEALLPDGKALQAGTSHDLGQNFSRAFQIRFESKNQTLEYAWQTSWGVSTRLIGALIMTHGDDSGLIMPPRLAPTQVVIVPITVGNWKEEVLPAARALTAELKEKGLRVVLDDDDTSTPGWKFSEWEMRGVPLRIEIGPRDLRQDQVMLVSRLNREKSAVKRAEVFTAVSAALDGIQQELFQRALRFREENTRIAAKLEELQAIIEEKRGFVRSGWCGSPECEARVKESCAATIRVIEDQADPALPACLACDRPARESVVFAKSY